MIDVKHVFESSRDQRNNQQSLIKLKANYSLIYHNHKVHMININRQQPWILVNPRQKISKSWNSHSPNKECWLNQNNRKNNLSQKIPKNAYEIKVHLCVKGKVQITTDHDIFIFGSPQQLSITTSLLVQKHLEIEYQQKGSDGGVTLQILAYRAEYKDDHFKNELKTWGVSQSTLQILQKQKLDNFEMVSLVTKQDLKELKIPLADIVKIKAKI